MFDDDEDSDEQDAVEVERKHLKKVINSAMNGADAIDRSSAIRDNEGDEQAGQFLGERLNVIYEDLTELREESDIIRDVLEEIEEEEKEKLQKQRKEMKKLKEELDLGNEPDESYIG